MKLSRLCRSTYPFVYIFFWMTSVSVCSRFIGVQNKFKTMNGLNHISLWLCTACLWEEWCGQSDPQRERYRFFLFVCVCVCLLLLLPFQIFNFFLNKSYSLSACLVFSYFLILSRLLSLLRLFLFLLRCSLTTASVICEKLQWPANATLTRLDAITGNLSAFTDIV